MLIFSHIFHAAAADISTLFMLIFTPPLIAASIFRHCLR